MNIQRFNMNDCVKELEGASATLAENENSSQLAKDIVNNCLGFIGALSAEGGRGRNTLIEILRPSGMSDKEWEGSNLYKLMNGETVEVYDYMEEDEYWDEDDEEYEEV